MQKCPYAPRRFPSFFKGMITSVLILCLTADPLAFAASAPVFDASKTSLKIPEKLGRIEESSEGLSGKTVFYIQDAHDSLEAQKNIAQLIERFVEKNSVKTVFEEGHEGTVPTDSYFGFITDSKIRRKVSYFLLDKLRLRAAEYAHINRKQPFQLIGADSRELHSKNVAQYRKTARVQRRMAKDLEALSQELETIQNINFPREFKEWIRLKERYENQELGFLDYLHRTFALIAPEKINDFPYLKLLLAAEKTQNETLVNRIKAADTKDFFLEADRLEDAAAEHFLKDPKDQKTFHYYKIIHLLQRLGKMKVSSAEFEAAKVSLKSFNTQDFAGFIAKELQKPVLLSRRWESAILRSVEFYELAEKRNQALEKTLDAFLHNPEEKTAVIVFGGFHKDSIREMLHRKEIAYSIITPRISAPDPVHESYYRQLMGVGHHDFEQTLALRAGVPVEGVFETPFGRAEIVAVYGGVSEIKGEPADWMARVAHYVGSRHETREEERPSADQEWLRRITTPLTFEALTQMKREEDIRVVPADLSEEQRQMLLLEGARFYPIGDEEYVVNFNSLGWDVIGSTLDFLHSTFDGLISRRQSLSDFILKKISKVPEGKTFTVLDWGAGTGQMLLDLYHRSQANPRARFIGFGRDFYPDWEQLPTEIRMILDDAPSLKKYFLPGGIYADHRPDIIISHYGLEHYLRENVGYLFEDIHPVLAENGLLAFRISQFAWGNMSGFADLPRYYKILRTDVRGTNMRFLLRKKEVTRAENREESSLIKIDEEESRRILENTEVHGSGYDGQELTKEEILKFGMQPAYKIFFNDRWYYFSGKVYELNKGRLGIPGYIELKPGDKNYKEDGKYVVRSYYRSNSQAGLWRYLPFAFVWSHMIRWLSKGHNEDSLALDYPILKAINEIRFSGGVFRIEDAVQRHLLFLGTTWEADEKQQRRGGREENNTYDGAVDPVGYSLNADSHNVTGFNGKTPPEAVRFTNLQESPDFDHLIDEFTMDTTLYSDGLPDRVRIQRAGLEPRELKGIHAEELPKNQRRISLEDGTKLVLSGSTYGRKNLYELTLPSGETYRPSYVGGKLTFASLADSRNKINAEKNSTGWHLIAGSGDEYFFDNQFQLTRVLKADKTVIELDYGMVTARVFDSKDGQHQFLFVTDKFGRSMIASVQQKNSPSTELGIRKSWDRAGNLVSALYEYYEQSGGYADLSDARSEYCGMWLFYNSRIPVIREFTEKFITNGKELLEKTDVARKASAAMASPFFSPVTEVKPVQPSEVPPLQPAAIPAPSEVPAKERLRVTHKGKFSLGNLKDMAVSLNEQGILSIEKSQGSSVQIPLSSMQKPNFAPVLGSSEKAPLRFEDPSVSPEHARLSFVVGPAPAPGQLTIKVYLQELNADDGTWIDEDLLDPEFRYLLVWRTIKAPATRAENRTEAAVTLLEKRREVMAAITELNDFLSREASHEDIADPMFPLYLYYSLRRPVMGTPPASGRHEEWEKFVPLILKAATLYPELEPDEVLSASSLKLSSDPMINQIRIRFLKRLGMAANGIEEQEPVGIELHRTLREMIMVAIRMGVEEAAMSGIRALGEFHSFPESSREAMAHFLMELYQSRRGTTPVREVILETLGRIGEKGSTELQETLKEKLDEAYEEEAANPRLQVAALQSLARLGDFSKIEALIYQQDPALNHDLIVDTIKRLGKIQSARAFNFLDNLIGSIEDESLIREALAALRSQGTNAAVRLLMNMTFHENDRLRNAALTNLEPILAMQAASIAAAHLKTIPSDDPRFQQEEIIGEDLIAMMDYLRLLQDGPPENPERSAAVIHSIFTELEKFSDYKIVFSEAPDLFRILLSYENYSDPGVSAEAKHLFVKVSSWIDSVSGRAFINAAISIGYLSGRTGRDLTEPQAELAVDALETLAAFPDAEALLKISPEVICTLAIYHDHPNRNVQNAARQAFVKIVDQISVNVNARHENRDRDLLGELTDTGNVIRHYHGFDSDGFSISNSLMISFAHFSPNLRKEIIRRIQTVKMPPAKVLSIGSGKGSVEKDLMDAGFQVQAVDLHKNNVRDTRLQGVPAIEADAHHLPFEDRAFDQVLFSESLGHLRLVEVFREAARVSKPGAGLFATTYPPFAGYEAERVRFYRYTAEEIRQALKDAGWEEVQIEVTSLKRFEKVSGTEDTDMYFIQARLPVPASEVPEVKTLEALLRELAAVALKRSKKDQAPAVSSVLRQALLSGKALEGTTLIEAFQSKGIAMYKGESIHLAKLMNERLARSENRVFEILRDNPGIDSQEKREGMKVIRYKDLPKVDSAVQRELAENAAALYRSATEGHIDNKDQLHRREGWEAIFEAEGKDAWFLADASGKMEGALASVPSLHSDGISLRWITTTYAPKTKGRGAFLLTVFLEEMAKRKTEVSWDSGRSSIAFYRKTLQRLGLPFEPVMEQIFVLPAETLQRWYASRAENRGFKIERRFGENRPSLQRFFGVSSEDRFETVTGPISTEIVWNDEIAKFLMPEDKEAVRQIAAHGRNTMELPADIRGRVETSGEWRARRTLIYNLKTPVVVEGVSYKSIKLKGILPDLRGEVITLAWTAAHQPTVHLMMQNGIPRLLSRESQPFGGMLEWKAYWEDSVARTLFYLKDRAYTLNPPLGRGKILNKKFRENKDLGFVMSLANPDNQDQENERFYHVIGKRILALWENYGLEVRNKKLTPERQIPLEAEIRSIREAFYQYGRALRSLHNEATHHYPNTGNVSLDASGKIRFHDLDHVMMLEALDPQDRLGYVANDLQMAMDDMSALQGRNADNARESAVFGSKALQIDQFFTGLFWYKINANFQSDFFDGYFQTINLETPIYEPNGMSLWNVGSYVRKMKNPGGFSAGSLESFLRPGQPIDAEGPLAQTLRAELSVPYRFSLEVRAEARGQNTEAKKILREKTAKGPEGKGRRVSINANELKTLLKTGSWTIISVHSEESTEPFADKKQRFEQQLKQEGFAFLTVTGKYQGQPQPGSYMIFDIPLRKASAFAEAFNQESFIYRNSSYRRGGKTLLIHPGKDREPILGIERNDREETQNYTLVSHAGKSSTKLVWRFTRKKKAVLKSKMPAGRHSFMGKVRQRSEARSDEQLTADRILRVLGYEKGLEALHHVLARGSEEGAAVDLAKKAQRLDSGMQAIVHEFVFETGDTSLKLTEPSLVRVRATAVSDPHEALRLLLQYGLVFLSRRSHLTRWAGWGVNYAAGNPLTKLAWDAASEWVSAANSLNPNALLAKTMDKTWVDTVGHILGLDEELDRRLIALEHSEPVRDHVISIKEEGGDAWRHFLNASEVVMNGRTYWDPEKDLSMIYHIPYRFLIGKWKQISNPHLPELRRRAQAAESEARGLISAGDPTWAQELAQWPTSIMTKQKSPEETLKFKQEFFISRYVTRALKSYAVKIAGPYLQEAVVQYRAIQNLSPQDYADLAKHWHEEEGIVSDSAKPFSDPEKIKAKAKAHAESERQKLYQQIDSLKKEIVAFKQGKSFNGISRDASWLAIEEAHLEDLEKNLSIKEKIYQGLILEPLKQLWADVSSEIIQPADSRRQLLEGLRNPPRPEVRVLKPDSATDAPVSGRSEMRPAETSETIFEKIKPQIEKLAEEVYLARLAEQKGAISKPVYAQRLCAGCSIDLEEKLNKRLFIEAPFQVKRIAFNEPDENEYHQFILLTVSGIDFVADPTWQQYLDVYDEAKPKVLVTPADVLRETLTQLGMPESRQKFWLNPVRKARAEAREGHSESGFVLNSIFEIIKQKLIQFDETPSDEESFSRIFRSAKPEYFKGLIEHRIRLKNISLEKYLELFQTASFAEEEIKFYRMVLNTFLSRQTYLFETRRMDEDRDIKAYLNGLFDRKRADQGEKKDSLVFRFTALGGGASAEPYLSEFQQIASQINQYLREKTGSDPQAMSVMAQKLQMVFHFYDLRPSVLSGSEEAYQSLIRSYPWLQQAESSFEVSNFLIPELMDGWGDESTAFVMARNLSDTTLASFYRQVSRAMIPDGLLIVDDTASRRIQQLDPKENAVTDFKMLAHHEALVSSQTQASYSYRLYRRVKNVRFESRKQEELPKRKKSAFAGFENKRVLIDFEDVKSFSDEQIKEVVSAADSGNRNVQVLIYNLDPTDPLGKFFLGRQSARFKVERLSFEEMARKYTAGFNGDIVHLSRTARVKADTLKRELGEVLAQRFYALSYQDDAAGTLGVGLRDLSDGKLRKNVQADQLTKPSYMGLDGQGKLFIADPEQAGMQFFQSLYSRAYAFARAA